MSEIYFHGKIMPRPRIESATPVLQIRWPTCKLSTTPTWLLDLWPLDSMSEINCQGVKINCQGVEINCQGVKINCQGVKYYLSPVYRTCDPGITSPMLQIIIISTGIKCNFTVSRIYPGISNLLSFTQIIHNINVSKQKRYSWLLQNMVTSCSRSLTSF